MASLARVKDKYSSTYGNFGNILAAYYAYRMGLPVNRFICASNDNNILTDFSRLESTIQKGFQENHQSFHGYINLFQPGTFSFEITGRDAGKIKQWYQDLKEEGKFEIDRKP